MAEFYRLRVSRTTSVDIFNENLQLNSVTESTTLAQYFSLTDVPKNYFCFSSVSSFNLKRTSSTDRKHVRPFDSELEINKFVSLHQDNYLSICDWNKFAWYK